jgi:hypothetical protein
MKKLSLLLVLVALVHLSALSQKANNVSGDPNYFMPAENLSELTDKRLEEVSGIGASVYNPGYLWAQNDSGNGPEIFLIDQQLHIKLTCKLKGVINRDWEDMAVGPGPDPGKSYIYIADIGDNFGIFPTKFIYRFEEPVLDSTKKEIVIKDYERIIFRLPGGTVKDSESMLVDPLTKNIFILSKEDTAHVYQLSYPYENSKKDTVIAGEVGAFSIPKITGGSFASNGEEILLKNYRRVWYWKNKEHKPLQEVLKVKGIMIPYDMEPQGEAIAWSHDNNGFYTLSEKKKDKKSFLYFYKRK